MNEAGGTALRVRVVGGDPVRRRGLATMVEAAGHAVVTDMADVVLCDLARDAMAPVETEAPVVVLTDAAVRGATPAGVLRRDVGSAQLDAALRAVAAGLVVRAPGVVAADGFRAAGDEPAVLLTPREAEILTLVGQGMSNKAAARALGISVHTVKFHLEALFAKLDATSRAEAVAKGLRGGVIEL